MVAAVIEPGSLAGILVYENLWAAPLMAGNQGDADAAALLAADIEGKIVKSRLH